MKRCGIFMWQSVAMAKSFKLLPLHAFQPPHYVPLLHPLSEHKVLGIGELRGTGMLLYLASPGLEEGPTAPAPQHKHSREDTHVHTHARTQAHKDSAATEPPCIQSGTRGALIRTCHSSPGIWLKWAGYQTLSSHRWGGFCHSRAVFWKERRECEKFIRNEQLVSACACARVFLSLTWLPVQHWAGQLDYHWWHSVKPGNKVSGA